MFAGKKGGQPVFRPTAREGQSVTYHLNTKLTVPSRNDEQFLEVAKIEMAPEYYYKAVPVLTAHVYRLANLTNKSKYVLLPGEATMYLGSDFVGRMDLPLVAIGEQFTAGFGVDPQLQVQRQMTDKTRTMQGGNQILKYEYRILVSSYKSEAVKLQVWDRLPHAEIEAVGVNLIKTIPGYQHRFDVPARASAQQSAALGPEGRTRHERRKSAGGQLRVQAGTGQADDPGDFHGQRVLQGTVQPAAGGEGPAGENTSSVNDWLERSESL